MKPTRTTSALAAAMALSLTHAVDAADGTYTSQTGDWNDAGSWVDGIIADATDSTAFFTNDVTTSTRTTSLVEDRTIGHIVFTDAVSSHNRVIANNILTFDVTAGRSTIDVTQSNRQLTLSSRLSGDDGLKLMGPGIVQLTNAQNDHGGVTEINAGTLWLAASGTAGSGTIQLGDTTGSANAELRMSATGTTINRPLEVREGSSGTKTLANRSTNSVNYSGAITVNDHLAILLAGATGGGVFSVSGTENSITSGKIVSFGITGGGTGRLNDSALWSGAGSISYTSDSAKGFTIRGAKTYSGGATLGAMSGTGVVVVQTSSNGPANAPTDGAFGTGMLTLGVTKMRGDTTGDITVGNPITFTDNPTFTTAGNEKSLIFSGNATLGDTRTLTVETGSTVPTAAVEFSGGISGAGFGITKEGAGILRLSGTHTYTGPTTVNAGILALGGGSLASPITVEPTGSLGFVVDTTTTSSSSVALGGPVKILGTPTLISYTLMTAAGGFTGTPTLDPAIADYVLVLEGNTLKLNSTRTDPYFLWSGGAAFNADSNQDGVANGLAWLLGAPNKDANAIDRLPKFSRNGGGLVMKFTCLKVAGRDGAALSLEHSGDLGLTDPWSFVDVPDAATTVGNIVFTVPTTNADPNLVDLEATIPATEALDGKLFGRLYVISP